MLAFIVSPDTYTHQATHDPTSAFQSLALSYACIFSLLYACTRQLELPPPSLKFGGKKVVDGRRGTAAGLKSGGGSSSSSSSSRESEEWANRLISTIHAIIACWNFLRWFVPYFFSSSSPQPSSTPITIPIAFDSSPTRDFSIGVTLGYLMFDLARLVVVGWIEAGHLRRKVGREKGMEKEKEKENEKEKEKSGVDFSMFLHHVIIITGYFLGVRYQYGTYYLSLFLHNELTTPFLNLRFFLRSLSLSSSPLAALNEYIFALLFLLSRIITNFFIIRHMQVRLSVFAERWDEFGVPTVVGVGLPFLAWCHVGLQVWWGGLIGRMVWRKVVGKAKVERCVDVGRGSVESQAVLHSKEKRTDVAVESTMPPPTYVESEAAKVIKRNRGKQRRRVEDVFFGEDVVVKA